MKRLQVLKNLFFRRKNQNLTTNKLNSDTIPKTMITRAFNKDEDTFMFI
ncbi:hypothetical protein [Winogradskyella psychrotolerans]|nr:hypothetical protein [Winogradskyella psychrotolerans]MBU2929419.1 hypothetical protein [Winogradskyella psychrotolerans]